MGEYQTPLHKQNKRFHVHVRLNSDMTRPGSIAWKETQQAAASLHLVTFLLRLLWRNLAYISGNGERGLTSRKLFKSWEITLWKCRELSKQSREEFLT